MDTEDNRVRDLTIHLSMAKELLKKTAWLLNTVPEFTDGVTKSHDLSHDINHFIEWSRKNA